MVASSSDLVSGKVVQDQHPGLEVAGGEVTPIPSAGSSPGCRDGGGRIPAMPGEDGEPILAGPGARPLEVPLFPMKWNS